MEKKTIMVLCILGGCLFIGVLAGLLTGKGGGGGNGPGPSPSGNIAGCKNCKPDTWTQNMNTLKGCNLKCNANNYTIEQLEKAKYGLVFSVNGGQIYDDLNGDRKYFYNWGEYTTPYGKGCKNEPTGSDCVYADMSDIKKYNLMQKTGDKLQIRAKRVGNFHGKDFASVRIHSSDSFTYGVFVYHITKVPDPAHYWSAAWLTAPYSCQSGDNDAKNKFGLWPYCGEIDVMEFIGGGTNSIGSLHVPCRHMDDPIQVSRKKTVPWNQPGYFVVEWTPKYLKMYYVPDSKGKSIFSQSTLNISDLSPYNITNAPDRCDNTQGQTAANAGWKNNPLPLIGGCDVTTIHTKEPSVIFEHYDPADDKTWVRLAGVPPCDLTKAATTSYPGNDMNAWLSQKKEAIMYPLGKHACEAGGMIMIMNIAINGNPPAGVADGVMEISDVKVYQL